MSVKSKTNKLVDLVCGNRFFVSVSKDEPLMSALRDLKKDFEVLL